jgi:glutamate-5-semialdehyde dehydrogenase
MNMMVSKATEIMAFYTDNAQASIRKLAESRHELRNLALKAAASHLRNSINAILDANKDDIKAAEERGLKPSFIDRLKLDEGRVEQMAKGLDDIVALPDPLGRVLDRWQRPNGLDISRVSTPLGVIGVIYEARPNVTVDAAGLAIKSGNPVILRGGSDSIHTSSLLARLMRKGLEDAGLPSDSVQLVENTDRALVGAMLTATGGIDVIIPRGGRSLVERVQSEARVPVFAHLEGICHVYIDRAADQDKARYITVNAKMRRVGICGAAETLLIDRVVADRILPKVAAALIDAGCSLRADADALKLIPDAKPASNEDWSTEYLDSILSIAVVDGVDGAIAHIQRYGSNHTEAIITEDDAAADAFTSGVDSAIVMVNASTQFADGGEFGMGAEIGISTGKMHARGPVGANELTSFKYIVRGSGQIRP